jgi:hypothetical protein
MFCAPGIVFGGTEGVRYRFHVFRCRTCFWSCGGRQILFSCFVRLDSFSAVPRVLGPVFMICATDVVSRGTEGVGSRYHVLRARTHFWRYRGHRVPLSCFARPNSFSAVLRTSGPVFMFCAPGHVFGSYEGVRSYFHILRSRTRFQPYRGHMFPFSCFALCTRFWLYQGRRVPFSYFVLPDSFSAVQRVLGPIYMFCAPRVVSRGTEGVGSHFHVLRSRTRSRRY